MTDWTVSWEMVRDMMPGAKYRSKSNPRVELGVFGRVTYDAFFCEFMVSGFVFPHLDIEEEAAGRSLKEFAHSVFEQISGEGGLFEKLSAFEENTVLKRAPKEYRCGICGVGTYGVVVPRLVFEHFINKHWKGPVFKSASKGL